MTEYMEAVHDDLLDRVINGELTIKEAAEVEDSLTQESSDAMIAIATLAPFVALLTGLIAISVADFVKYKKAIKLYEENTDVIPYKKLTRHVYHKKGYTNEKGKEIKHFKSFANYTIEELVDDDDNVIMAFAYERNYSYGYDTITTHSKLYITKINSKYAKHYEYYLSCMLMEHDMSTESLRSWVIHTIDDYKNKK